MRPRHRPLHPEERCCDQQAANGEENNRHHERREKIAVPWLPLAIALPLTEENTDFGTSSPAQPKRALYAPISTTIPPVSSAGRASNQKGKGLTGRFTNLALERKILDGTS